MIDTLKPTFIAVAILASVVAAPASATNLVVNGGFETGDFTGWTRHGDLEHTDVTSDTRWVASGSYGVYAGPVAGYGHLDQAIATLPNHNYRINFHWTNPYPILEGNNYLSVDFNSQQLFLRANDSTGPDFVYASLLGVSTGTSTLLGFTFANPPSTWALDDISVTDLGAINAPPPVGGVPEPATWLTLITGFGLVGFAMRQSGRHRRLQPVAA